MNRASDLNFKTQISHYFSAPPQLLYMIRNRGAETIPAGSQQKKQLQKGLLFLFPLEEYPRFDSKKAQAVCAEIAGYEIIILIVPIFRTNRIC